MSYCFHLSCVKPHNADHAFFCTGCGAKLLLGDRYRFVKLLGAGGFGRTYLAIDEYKPSQPPCAIKQLVPQNQGTTNLEKAARLFQQEAVKLEQLGQHPQIPDLYAYFTESDRQYLIQEYINGQNLAQELEEQGAFSEAQVIQLLQDLLPVLKFVHEHQVIHRDIKPENIIRRREDNKLFLVDFGAAKCKSKTTFQQTGTIIGSAAYTAPEQLLGKATFASDIYSLGVSCVHFLTDIEPFDLFDSGEGSWVWRDYLRSPISGHLAKILDKMLQPALKRRYQSVEGLLSDLLPALTFAKTGFKPLQPFTQRVSPPPPPPPITPAVQAGKMIPTNPKLRVEQTLREVLKQYWVSIKVHWGQNYLTIILSRQADTPINYSYLLREILTVVEKDRLPEIEQLKVYGLIADRPKPEWQHIQDLTSNAIVVKSANPKPIDFTTQEYWLYQVQQKRFWLDALSFSLISFVFGFRIVLWNPFIAVLAATGFLWVKSLMQKDKDFQERKLSQEVILITALLGFLGLRFTIHDGFAIILACLLAAIPMLYVKGNSG